MARQLQTNNNGALEFTEFVWDDDEDNVTHPLLNVVELYKKDGSPIAQANRRPSWLSATVNELGVNSTKERWEEEVNVTIADAENNLTTGTYTFRFLADDGKEQTEHTVQLQVN